MPEHGLGERIADQDDVDPGLIHQSPGSVVVRRQAGDGLVTKLLFSKGCTSDLLAGFANGGKTHDVLQCPSALADRACTPNYCSGKEAQALDRS